MRVRILQVRVIPYRNFETSYGFLERNPHSTVEITPIFQIKTIADPPKFSPLRKRGCSNPTPRRSFVGTGRWKGEDEDVLVESRHIEDPRRGDNDLSINQERERKGSVGN